MKVSSYRWFLVLLACIILIHEAAALEFYKNDLDDGITVTGNTQQILNLTFNAQGGDYIIIASFNLLAPLGNDRGIPNLTIDGIKFADYDWTAVHPNENNETFLIVNKSTLSAGSHTIRLWLQVPAGNTIWISSSRISVLSFGSEDNYNNTETEITVPTTFSEIVNLTFTPARGGNYLFLATAERHSTDTKSQFAQTWVDGNLLSDQSIVVVTSNDYHSFAVSRVVFLNTSTHSAKIEAKTTTSGNGFIRRSRILAIRLTDYYPFATNSSTSQETESSGNWKEKVNLTFTPPFTADNLIFATAETGSDTTGPGKSIVVDVLVDGTRAASHTYGTTNKANLITFGQHKNISLSSTLHTISMRFRRTGSNNAIIQNASITAIIPDIFSPNVTSNTNNIYVANNTLLTLNATVTDLGSGARNATVNVSGVNATLNGAVLTNTSGFWLNATIMADKGETNGFVNLTITAYDNATNVNSSINMTVWIDETPPTKPENFTNVTVPTSRTVEVSWNASTDAGSGMDKYQLERTNDSFNYLSVARDSINATGIVEGYEQDAYWYTYRTNEPVDCTTCHASGRTKVGNLWVKYNESYLYAMMHAPDNDTSGIDDKVRLAFDVNLDGGSAPQSDDRMYQITEENNLTFYKGNGTGWELNTTGAVSAVAGNGTLAPRYEIRIPLSEIGSPGNTSSIGFMFENECTNCSEFVRRDAYFPAEANETVPSSWKTITFRNETDYVWIANTTSTSYLLQDLNGSYRYNFTVRAVDNVVNIGERSDPLIIQTDESPAYNITGYLLNEYTQQGIAGGFAKIFDYMVTTNSTGYYILKDMPNGTYDVIVNATGFIGTNTTTVVVSGADVTGVNLSLTPIEIIDVTLSNDPVEFGNVSPGIVNQPAFRPLNITIESTTDVEVNLTLSGTDFTSGAYSFGVGNLSYSNSSGGTKTSMTASFPLPPYADWVNITRGEPTNRSIYFWLNIPAGQWAGGYSNSINVRVEKHG